MVKAHINFVLHKMKRKILRKSKSNVYSINNLISFHIHPHQNFIMLSLLSEDHDLANIAPPTNFSVFLIHTKHKNNT